MTTYDDERFSEEEVTELLGAAGLFLDRVTFPAAKRAKIKRLWYMKMHQFSFDVMSDLEWECPPDMEKCRDGACMQIGGC